MVVNVFLTSTTVVLINFAEGAKSRPTILLESCTKIFYRKSIDTFCFSALKKSVAHNIEGITEKHCLSEEILSSKESDTKLLQSIYFAYEVGIINFYSNRISYWKMAKSRTKHAWKLHAALRTVFKNHCSTSNTTPATYDVTAFAIKHQRLADRKKDQGLQIHWCSLVS